MTATSDLFGFWTCFVYLLCTLYSGLSFVVLALVFRRDIFPRVDCKKTTIYSFLVGAITGLCWAIDGNYTGGLWNGILYAWTVGAGALLLASLVWLGCECERRGI